MRLLFLFTVLSILSGCAGNHIKTADGRCLTCFNNPITGEGINHDGNYSSGQVKVDAYNIRICKEKMEQEGHILSCDHRLAQSPVSGDFDIVAPVSVELAYARLKKHFGYDSLDDIKRKHGESYAAWKVRDVGYQHTISPGAYYVMKEKLTKYRFEGTLVGVSLKTYVETLKNDSSTVTLTYHYFDSSIPKAQFENHLKEQLYLILNM